MDRGKLPYRKNCEGYFKYKQKYILARDTGFGYLEFPGGGVEQDDIETAMRRETYEETGATVSNLKQHKKVYFDWDEHWAKTPKQITRYQIFRGEEMILFTGEAESLVAAKGDAQNGESGWPDKPYIEIARAIELINSFRPFRKAMASYHEEQIKILNSFIKK